MAGRRKTTYPGVFYREADRIGGKGTEKVYYVVFKKDGKIIEEKVGRQYADAMTASKAARIRAERIEGKRRSRKELREEEAARKAAEEGRWTVAKLFDEYIKHRPDNKARKVDRGRFEKYIGPALSDKEPKDILPLDVKRLSLKLSKSLAPQTVKHILNLFVWTVHFGVKNNLCPGLSFHIEKPKVNNLKTEDLNAEQLQSLLKAIDDDENEQVRAIMKTALYTGMRRGELFKLKWEDIDFDRGFITIRDPKGGKDAVIPLNDAAREVLEPHERISEFVFPGREGKQRVDVNHQVRRIAKAAGLPKDFRPLHGLRHLYASMLASSGQVDMYTLQRLLTHKSPLMTQRYAHLRDETLRNASNLMGELVNGKCDEVEQKVLPLKK